MRHFFRWLLGHKPSEAAPSSDPLNQPPKKKSSNLYRLDQGIARNQIDSEKKQKRRPADELGEQEAPQ
jgi:hypothetical protein